VDSDNVSFLKHAEPLLLPLWTRKDCGNPTIFFRLESEKGLGPIMRQQHSKSICLSTFLWHCCQCLCVVSSNFPMLSPLSILPLIMYCKTEDSNFHVYINVVILTFNFLKVVLHRPTCNANFSRIVIAPFFFTCYMGTFFCTTFIFILNPCSTNTLMMSVFLLFLLQSILYQKFYCLCFCNSARNRWPTCYTHQFASNSSSCIASF